MLPISQPKGDSLCQPALIHTADYMLSQ